MQKLLILLLSLLIVSCASTSGMRNTVEVQRGKSNFEAGNYRQAFQQLLPPAAAGNRDAQYAVGYMYYYGYGVQQDNETGIFWIKRSADQGYQPAVQALRSIRAPVQEGASMNSDTNQ